MENGNKLDLFNHWIFVMEDALDVFLNELPHEVANKLDYTVESLNILEKWLLEKYSSPEEMKSEKEKDLVDKVARYIGETFRKNIGGYWDIALNDKSNVYYNLPTITGYSKKSTPFSPHTLSTTTADRRTGSFLSTVLTKAIERKNKEE